MSTLATRMDQEDERRFVGRKQELALVDDVLAGRSPAHVLVVHGPGGIGKSTLLRQVRRQAERAGWETREIDGRDGLPTTSELEERLGGDETDQGRLVLLDTYERMSSLGPQLRGRVLPGLPDRSLIVIAQRGSPDPGWLQGGWERVTRALALAPVSDPEAQVLLERDGVTDDKTRARLMTWAGGSPLALTLGAAAARNRGAWGIGGLDDNVELADLLVQRLTESELDAGHLDVITVAALARRTDAAMLADVLPGVDGPQAEEWLRSRTFAESRGGWVTLHDLVRDAVRAQARGERPERERELRRRITEHLYQRAAAGESGLLADLAELVDNEVLRWAIPGEGPTGLRVDDVSPGDLDDVPMLVTHRGVGDWLAATKTLVQEAPRCAVVAKDTAGRLCGLCIAVAAGDAPAAAERDPILGSWVTHARANAPDGNALIWRDSLDLTPMHGTTDSRVLPLLNTVAIKRSGLSNPRWSYLPIDPGNLVAVEFARNVGARHVPELDVAYDGKVQECHILDHGPGGMFAAYRAAVYEELQLEPPPVGADADAGASREVTADTVKEALRTLDRPLELSRSPLAHGQTVAERAASVRDVLVNATEGAFGNAPAERLLHDVIVERYLGEPTTHEQTAERLHVSRSTYFRHLGAAVDRVAAYTLQGRA